MELIRIKPDGLTAASGTRKLPISAAARSGSWVCGRSLAGFAGSNPARGMGVYIVSFVCCQTDVSASD
jgi:hypothetical protein